jgi:hypothetical protein
MNWLTRLTTPSWKFSNDELAQMENDYSTLSEYGMSGKLGAVDEYDKLVFGQTPSALGRMTAGVKGLGSWLTNSGMSTTIQGKDGVLATLPGQTGLEKLGGYGKGLLEAGQLWTGIGAARKQGKYIDTMIASQKLNQDLMRNQMADAAAASRRREAINTPGVSSTNVYAYGKTGDKNYLTMSNYG